MRRKKPTRADLEKSLKRDKKRKALRLDREQRRVEFTKKVHAGRANAQIVAIRQAAPRLRGEAPAPGQVVFGMRTGLFGHPTQQVLRIQDEKIAGACENMSELGEIVSQIGILTLGALVNYNLAEGPEGLAKALAKWAAIDLEALRKEAEESDIAEGLSVHPILADHVLQSPEVLV